MNDYGLDQDALELLTIVCILGLIGSIACFGIGFVSIIQNKIKLATCLAGFCLFGQLSLHLGMMITYSYTLPMLIASAICAFFGSFLCLIPDKYKPVILGAGMGASLTSFSIRNFFIAELGLIVCVISSILFGIILFKFPQHAKHAALWIGSYFFVSGLMFAILFTSLTTNLFGRETLFYVDVMSYGTIIGSAIVFVVRLCFSKDTKSTDQVA